jgi:hypothetical protein
LGIDLEKVRDYFVGSLRNSGGRYLKTPSVIVTYNDLLTTGGHNISSKISRVGSTTNYKRSSGGSAPVAQVTPPPASKPSTPATSSPSSSAKPASTAKPSSGGTPTSGSKSTTTAKPSGSVRPRTSVVGGGARTTRGF